MLALRRFVLPDDRDAEWLVVDARGSIAARWLLPLRLRVLAASLGRVFGVEADEDGVESLVVYELK